ncbi:MAG: helix-turn-helix transcriptional regulator [Candidatus Accumulibacter meliphilus]|uniref:helix-turn-helix domain-containing protein n=1 Tax=Candidatus Accumulibacter TaxID=327159 RepID=UPI001AC371F3|nr:helix-turn-helix transcriptional regulator [Accumulibacter sp.]MBK8384380.1 helix-turn-helix transcriptional regulator [Accumulibacter sp.]MBK8577325.1 helix-turn-helix transcriptional regulator [Candidatus Accumulibacter propinquus]MBN8439154.1 helix-turn-helix transcriptional regulator [Accumulibacter sp.]
MSQTDRQTSPSGPACRTECRARRLKLADICRAAGIARTTLDRYYHDQVKSIDREVLGRLCQYLRVKPGVADFAVKPRTNRATNQQNRRPASADYFFQTI